MNNKSGWVFVADTQDPGSDYPAVVNKYTVSNLEELLAVTAISIRNGCTRITITEEDRTILDGRKRARCIPTVVEIEGEAGLRRVKQK